MAENSGVPVQVSGVTSGVTSLSLNDDGAACVVTTGGSVTCWGDNSSGVLGDGVTAGNDDMPAVAEGLSSGATSVSLGQNTGGAATACAVMGGGGVTCWGDLTWFSNQSTPAPLEVSGLSDAVAVSVSTSNAKFACALTSGGAVQCWGYNENGQLGDGTSTDRLAPVPVVGLSSGVAAIAVGGYACALKTNGAVVCWGTIPLADSLDGGPSSVPVPIQGLPSAMTAISVGQAGGCGLTVGGAVVCWSGLTAMPTVVTQVPGLSSGVTSLSVGERSACAVTAAGAVMCWGDNTFYELGNGTENSTLNSP
jgi:alpha-tubulin suppressor-like RCC1 family protein